MNKANAIPGSRWRPQPRCRLDDEHDWSFGKNRHGAWVVTVWRNGADDWVFASRAEGVHDALHQAEAWLAARSRKSAAG